MISKIKMLKDEIRAMTASVWDILEDSNDRYTLLLEFKESYRVYSYNMNRPHKKREEL